MDVTKGSKFGNFTLWEEITPVKEEDKGCPTGFADYGTYCLESYLYANGDYRYNYTVYFNATTNLTKNNNINYTIPISNLPNFNSKNASWSYAINGTSANLTNLTDATNLYITIGNNFSSSSLYQGVWIFSVQYYIPSESVPPGGGGSDFIGPAITYVSGNWTFTKESAFLIMSANSTIETYFTIDNRENVNITNFEITCSSEHDLCNYVVFKEMIIMESIPLLQTFAIPPGKMADISYSITLPLDLDLKAFEIYDIVLMVKIGKIQRPFTVSIWYLPGGQVIAGGFSWFAGSTFGIPNWLILVFIVIVIIVIVLLAIKEINKPKWYKLIKR